MAIKINGDGSITGVTSIDNVPGTDVKIVPTGGISATNAQEAIAELEADKASLSVLAASGGAGMIGYLPAGVGAVPRSVEGKLMEWVSVKDFGAAGGGIVDDTSAFEKAILGCKTLGTRRLRLVGGTYKVSRRLTVDFSDFVIDGGGATIIWAGTGLDNLDTGVFQFVGTESGTGTTVTVNAAEYTDSMMVADASIFAVGDVVQIYSAATTLPGKYLNVTTRITKIVGNVITTDVVRRLPLTASEVVTVAKLNAVERSGVKNCNFVATGQTSRANGMGGIFFQYTANCFAENLTFSGFWFKGVKAQFSLNMLMSSILCLKPAATNGGEGYATQFSYAYNSVAEKVVGIDCRHTVDVTASSHIRVSDCFDSDGRSASFLTHTSYEYDIVFDRCTSHGNTTDGAFALGIVTGEFADTTDNIVLSSCAVVDCSAPVGISYRNKGSGLKISNTTVQMRSGVSAAAVAVGNANVQIDNSELIGGLRTESDVVGGAFNSGDILVSNSVLKSQDSQRAMLILDGYRVRMSNSTCDGVVQLGNGYLFADNSRFVIQAGGTQYFDFIGAAANTGEFRFKCSHFDPSASASGAKNFYGNLICIESCSFGLDPNGQPTNIFTKKFVFNGNTGVIRLNVLAGVQDMQFSNNTLDALLGTARIFNAFEFTGRLVAVSNNLRSDSVANGCFIILGSNLLEVCIFANNHVKGAVVIDNAEVTNVSITGNVVNGSATYPAPSSQKVVANNVAY